MTLAVGIYCDIFGFVQLLWSFAETSPLAPCQIVAFVIKHLNLSIYFIYNVDMDKVEIQGLVSGIGLIITTIVIIIFAIA